MLTYISERSLTYDTSHGTITTAFTAWWIRGETFLWVHEDVKTKIEITNQLITCISIKQKKSCRHTSGQCKTIIVWLPLLPVLCVIQDRKKKLKSRGWPRQRRVKTSNFAAKVAVSIESRNENQNAGRSFLDVHFYLVSNCSNCALNVHEQQSKMSAGVEVCYVTVSGGERLKMNVPTFPPIIWTSNTA